LLELLSDYQRLSVLSGTAWRLGVRTAAR
jgi:hypothetical protein